MLAAAISSGCSLPCALALCMSVHAVPYVGMMVYMEMLFFLGGGGDLQLSGHITMQIKRVGVLLGQAFLLTWQCTFTGYLVLLANC